jgi:hypothetical protein
MHKEPWAAECAVLVRQRARAPPQLAVVAVVAVVAEDARTSGRKQTQHPLRVQTACSPGPFALLAGDQDRRWGSVDRLFLS